MPLALRQGVGVVHDERAFLDAGLAAVGVGGEEDHIAQADLGEDGVRVVGQSLMGPTKLSDAEDRVRQVLRAVGAHGDAIGAGFADE